MEHSKDRNINDLGAIQDAAVKKLKDAEKRYITARAELTEAGRAIRNAKAELMDALAERQRSLTKP